MQRLFESKCNFEYLTTGEEGARVWFVLYLSARGRNR
jgi:hypothetical protein